MKLPKFLFCLLLISCGNLIAQEDPFREIFAVAPADELSVFRVEARGGEVRINPAEDDSIRVEVKMTMNTIPDDEAESRLRRIRIEDEIVGERWNWNTNLDGMDIEWMTRIIEIEYQIYLPSHIALEVVQSNGDITVADMEAPVWIELTLGSLSGGCLSSSDNRIDVTFGKANLRCIGDAKVDLSGARFTVGSANDLKLRSKGADVSILEVGNVDIQAHAGEYRFRRATSIEGALTSSRIDIDTLLQKGELDLTLMLGAEFGLMEETESLELEADMTPLSVIYPGERPVALDLEARRDDLHRIDLPGLPEEEDLPDNKIRYRSDWSVARSEDPPLELTIHSKRGKVEIRKKEEE